MRLIALTLALWLATTATAFADEADESSTAYQVGHAFGVLFFAALVIGLVFLVVRKLSRR
jgi:flagellar biogenesis protein FliO